MIQFSHCLPQEDRATAKALAISWGENSSNADKGSGKHWLNSEPVATGCNSEVTMSVNRSEKGCFITFSSRTLTVPELIVGRMQWAGMCNDDVLVDVME